MINKYFLFLFLIFLAFNAQSQIVISEENDSEIMVIRDSEIVPPSKNKNVAKNIWKVDVLGPIHGKFGATYERELLSFLSIEASAGMSYINFYEFLMSFFSFGKQINLPSQNSFYLSSYRIENILNGTPGYFFRAIPKIYSANDGFDGLYFGFGINYAKWNYKVSKMNVSYNAIDNKQLGGEFAFGYQRINGKMAFDFSTSLGINRNTSSFFDSNQTYNSQYRTIFYGVSLKLGRQF